MYKGFWSGNMRGRGRLAGSWSRWKDNIKTDLREIGQGAWSGLIWFRIETSCGIMRT
jgi:hypothetical protein